MVLRQTGSRFADRHFEGIDVFNYQQAGVKPCMKQLLVQSNQIDISAFSYARSGESAMELLW